MYWFHLLSTTATYLGSLEKGREGKGSLMQGSILRGIHWQQAIGSSACVLVGRALLSSLCKEGAKFSKDNMGRFDEKGMWYCDEAEVFCK